MALSSYSSLLKLNFPHASMALWMSSTDIRSTGSFPRVMSTDLYGVSPGFAPMLSMALLFLAGILAVGLAAHALHRMLESAFAGGIDRMLGLLAGLAKGLLFAGVIGYIAIRLLPDVDVVRHSQVLPPLMRFIQALAGSLDLHLPPM